jgi:hypothetical protein
MSPLTSNEILRGGGADALKIATTAAPAIARAVPEFTRFLARPKKLRGPASRMQRRATGRFGPNDGPKTGRWMPTGL